MNIEIQDCIAKTVTFYPAHLRADLSQELWIVALERLPAYDPAKGSLGTFMYLRLHGACRNWIAANIQDTTDLEDGMLTEEPVDLDTIERLPEPDTREFISLKLSEGYTMLEIFDKFPATHGYKSLKSLYNSLWR